MTQSQIPKARGEAMNSITLDWDIKYSTFRSSRNYRHLRSDLFTRCYAKSIWARPSSSSNTHIKIEFDTSVTQFGSLILRRHYKDDSTRILLDLDRCYNHMLNPLKMNRLWDFKIYSDGRSKRAGKWRLIWKRKV